MLPIIWKFDARADLASIIQYIAKRDIAAARRMRQRLHEAVLPVAEHPYLYRQRVFLDPATVDTVAFMALACF